MNSFGNHCLAKTITALLLLVAINTPLSADVLTPVRVLALAEAEQMALKQAPSIERLLEQSKALRERAVADGEWPDPRIKLGVMNAPTDTYALDQEPMTQTVIGLQQALPRGRSHVYKEKQTETQSRIVQLQAENQRRAVLRDVRQYWLEFYYWSQAERMVRENQKLFDKLLEITESHYARGRVNQSNVMMAKIEAGLLEDRLHDIQTQRDKAMSNLLELTGGTQAILLPEAFPGLPSLASQEVMQKRLQQHPHIQMAALQVQGSDYGLSMAKQGYKPKWMLDLTYGKRDYLMASGEPASDFVSLMISFDLPFLTGDQAGKKVAASRRMLSSARYQQEETQRQIQRLFDSGMAEWHHLKKRLNNYQQALLLQAKQNQKAATQAYRSDAGSFSELMRASITELNTQLQALRVRVNHAKTQSVLLYLTGEQQ